MNQHTIIIEIGEDGSITGEVKGVTGKSCSDISKWLDELGEVTEDRHTPDYYKPDQSIRRTGKIA